MKSFYPLIFITLLLFGGLIFGQSLMGKPKTLGTTSNSTDYLLPTQTLAPVTPSPTLTPKQASQLQIIKATYSLNFGFQPQSLTVKAGLPVRLEVASADDGQGCMGSIMIPELLPRDIQFFRKGETNVFEFTPTTPSTYQITCAMGVPHGEITVQ